MGVIEEVVKQEKSNQSFNDTAERQWAICSEMNAGKAVAVARNKDKKVIAISIAVVETELVDILWPLIENAIARYDAEENGNT